MTQCLGCNTFSGPFKCCKNCKSVWFCNSANFACENYYSGQLHFQTCLPTIASKLQKLNFKIKDKVVCKSNSQWEQGFVSQLWPISVPNALYLISVKDYFVPVFHDCSDQIRADDFDHRDEFQVLKHHLKHGDNDIILNGGINVIPEWYDLLLWHCAKYGNSNGCISLLKNYGISPYVVDDKGRNILQIAVMSKMVMFAFNVKVWDDPDVWAISGVNVNLPKLLFALDSDGRNLLHLTVIVDGLDILNQMLTGCMAEFDPTSEFFSQPDAKGRTPLDYAILLKRDRLIDQVGALVLERKSDSFKKERLQVLDGKKPEEGIFLDVVKRHFSIENLTIQTRFSIPKRTQQDLAGVIFVAVRYGFVGVIKWALETWQVDTRLFGSPVAFNKMAVEILCKSEVSEITDEVIRKLSTGSVHDIKQRLQHGLYDLCVDWAAGRDTLKKHFDGVSPLAQIALDSMHFPHRYKRGGSVLSPHHGGCSLKILTLFVDQNRNFLHSVVKKDRVSMFEFIIDRYPPGEHISVDMILLVQSRQVGMLRKYVKRCQVDLHAPIKSNKAILEHSRGVGNRTHASSNISICEYLCLQAVCMDAVLESQWLLSECGDKLFLGGGLNVLQIAIKSGSFLTVKWMLQSGTFSPSDVLSNNFAAFQCALQLSSQHIAELLVSVLGSKSTLTSANLTRQYYAMTGSCCITQRWNEASAFIQSMVRGHLVYVKNRRYLGPRHIGWLRFKGHWNPVIQQLKLSSSVSHSSWATLKKQHDIVVECLQEDQARAAMHLATTAADEVSRVTALALVSGMTVYSSPQPLAFKYMSSDVEAVRIDGDLALKYTSQPALENIELSSHALKWLSGADPVFRGFFFDRVARLANGERSYALSKRLKGCAYPVYESKLDRGERVLWTKLRRGTVESILIWFVSHHDDVSDCLRLITNASKRLTREIRTSEAVDSIDTALQLGEEDVLLDPAGNTPLKIYQSSRADVVSQCTGPMENWRPPLRLGNKQRQVNEESGTVLLLGRSGTGKTLCLCDRILSDKNQQMLPIRQLFVCRNKTLCEFVRNYQEKHSDAASIVNMHFMTLASFTSQMNIYVKMDHGASKQQFAAVNKVDFRRFTMKVFPSIAMKCTVSSSVTWLQIRSFIKGSIEAAIQGGSLTIEQYLDLSVFGLDRCRLLVADRKKVYALYLRYEDVLKTQGLWDDADYTLDLLTRSKLEPLSTQYDKVYVDEVQDNTQAEIVLYFLASGMNTQSLFLAGDPAQSVVEGVDFRFEDVRSS